MVDGNKLHGARRKLRMTQIQLAKVAGVSPRTVRRAEKGLDISDESLRCICAVLAIDCTGVAAPVIAQAPAEASEPSEVPTYAISQPGHSTVAPVRLPTMKEYLRDDLLRGLLDDSIQSIPMLLFIFSMPSALMAISCVSHGQPAWGCYFAAVTIMAPLLGLLSGECIEKQGVAIYGARSWASAALAPVSLVAALIMWATHPIVASVGVPYLLGCAVFGARFSAAGVHRILEMRTMRLGSALGFAHRRP